MPEFVRRVYEKTRSWEQHKADILEGYRDKSDLSARVVVPLALRQFTGEPQTQSVVVYDTALDKWGKYYIRFVNRSGRTKLWELVRFDQGGIKSPEADWMDEALPYTDLTGSQVNASGDAPGFLAAHAVEDYVRGWLGQGSFLLAHRSYSSDPEDAGEYVVTWSGFTPMAEGARANTHGIPRPSYYKPSADYRQLVAQEALQHLMTRPWVEKEIALRLSDPGPLFVSNFQEAYVGALFNDWKPEQRIPLGFLALPKIHPGNGVTSSKNAELKRQESKFAG